jgi:hypothetical protein
LICSKNWLLVLLISSVIITFLSPFISAQFIIVSFLLFALDQNSSQFPKMGA